MICDLGGAEVSNDGPHCLVPRIYFSELEPEEPVKYHLVLATLDLVRCAKEVLWWAWGHNEDVLVYGNSEIVTSVLMLFLTECMAFTPETAREFVLAKRKI